MTEYTFQLNVKLGKGYDAHLVNVTGIGAADFKENLQWVTTNAAGIASAATALEAAYAVAPLAPNVTGAQVTNEAPGQWADRSHAQQPQQQPQQAYQQPAAQPQQQNQAPAPGCPHGAMKFVAAGTSKAGNAYKAFWSCQGPRDGQCKTVNA